MRRKFRYNPETKQMDEVTDTQYRGRPSLQIMNDIEPFVSTIDGSVITSRSHLREHMRQHGVTNAADYNKPGGYWDKAQQRRADFFAGKINPDSSKRIEQIKRAIEIHRNRK